MRSRLIPLILGAVAVLWTLGCSESDPDATLRLTSTCNVDGSSLVDGVLAYQNDAGQTYSVTRLQFYLSGFVLIHADGSNEPLDGVLYVDALKQGVPASPAAENELTMLSVPPGDYKGIRFYVGIAGDQNEHGKLENTVENTNMYWPDELGGGYHYMKIEGHFASGDTTLPYATHTGRVIVPDTQDKVEYYVTVTGDFPKTHFGSGESWAINLAMNVNEWYRDPNTYAFPEAAFIMNNHDLQATLKENGQSVMTVEPPVNLNYLTAGGATAR